MFGNADLPSLWPRLGRSSLFVGEFKTIGLRVVIVQRSCIQTLRSGQNSYRFQEIVPRDVVISGIAGDEYLRMDAGETWLATM